MKVIFKTNVDHYKTNCWPTNIDIPPRKGDTVMVVEAFDKHYQSKRLPTEMEVVNVTWTEKAVLCELWYKAIDVRLAELSGVKLL